ncbi:TPA: hypothetical protein ACH3X1_016550 [Trebouxia sp. C0004]
MANIYGKRIYPGLTRTRPGSDLEQIETYDSLNEKCQATLIKRFLRHQWQLTIVGDTLLNSRLEFTFEELPHRQPQQDTEEFLKGAGDAIRSFHAIQAAAFCCCLLVRNKSKRSLCMIHGVQAYLKLIWSALFGSPFNRRVGLVDTKALLELSLVVCNDPSPMHCNTGFGEMYSPMLRAALENRLTAALCHCKYTYESLLFIQGCSDPSPMHCNTGVGIMHSSLLRAALQNRLTAALYHCNHTCEDLLFIQSTLVQSACTKFWALFLCKNVTQRQDFVGCKSPQV